MHMCRCRLSSQRSQVRYPFIQRAEWSIALFVWVINEEEWQNQVSHQRGSMILLLHPRYMFENAFKIGLTTKELV